MDLSEVEMLVAELETRIDRLRALYEQYFLGFEKTEPLVVRKDVERRFDKLRKSVFRNTALRFRFSMMQQRYSTLSSYWMRICRQIEEGTYKRHLLRAKARFGDPKAPQSNSASQDVSHDEYEIDVDMDDDAAAATDFDADFGRIAAVTAPVSIVAVDRPLRAPPGPPPPPTSIRSTMEMLREEARLLEMRENEDAPPSFSNARTPHSPPLPVGPAAAAAAAAVALARTAPTATPPVMIRQQITIPRTMPSAFRPMSPGEARDSMQNAREPGAAAGVSAQPPPRPAGPSVISAAPGPVARPIPPGPSSSARLNPPGSSSSAGSPYSTQRPQSAISARSPGVPSSGTASSAGAAPVGAGSRGPGSTARDPGADAAGLSDARVRDLYAKYIDAKRDKQESIAQITYETVARSLRDSSTKLKEKHGGKNIDFEVAEKDGKVILRPILKR